jgi:hypothetical protein
MKKEYEPVNKRLPRLRYMKRTILSLTMGCMLAGLPASTTQAKSVKITPSTAQNRVIAATLQEYLTDFSRGDLRKAYAMFADIRQHLSLKAWYAQGDPQLNSHPLLTRVHVIGKENIAEVYAVMQLAGSTQTPSHTLIFVYPMIRQGGVWKMVYDQSDFGKQKSVLFKKLGQAIGAYANKQPRSFG